MVLYCGRNPTRAHVKWEESLCDFRFGTCLGRFPTDSVAVMAVKELREFVSLVLWWGVLFVFMPGSPQHLWLAADWPLSHLWSDTNLWTLPCQCNHSRGQGSEYRLRNSSTQLWFDGKICKWLVLITNAAAVQLMCRQERECFTQWLQIWQKVWWCPHVWKCYWNIFLSHTCKNNLVLSVSDGSLKESESELLDEAGRGVSHFLVLFGSLWSVTYTSFVTLNHSQVLW